MRAYSLFHLLWLAAIILSSILAAVASRREWIPRRVIRYALAALLVGGELQRYFTDGMAFPDRVPLNLCNVTTWVAVVACVTLSPVACEFVYFWGLIGAGMALITPDMGAAWPPRFFVNHGALIITAIAFSAGRIMPVRRGAMPRAYGWCVAYIAVMGLYNWRFGTNFAFIARKPSYPTLLDVMGPWPFYVGSAALLGFALLYLLWLPLRHRVQSEPLLVAENFQGLALEQAISCEPSAAQGE